jgi:hypothetical protein
MGTWPNGMTWALTTSPTTCRTSPKSRWQRGLQDKGERMRDLAGGESDMADKAQDATDEFGGAGR